MAKLTARERKVRAAIRKELRAQGALPPPKKRLDRRRYINEAQAEWEARGESWVWDLHIMSAISYMLGQTDRRNIGSPSLEAVGVAKVLKLALRLHQYSEMMKAQGRTECKVLEKYEYIKDILEM